ncbi:uncharacterized protein [Dermacentor andersoni]|uniref:uncharacterized protein n=1 Tax=Dermacentor andersoni TaxID=34620 RepID=UPI0021556B3B|nr:glycine-rich protein-like [Dermacentor andersoni]
MTRICRTVASLLVVLSATWAAVLGAALQYGWGMPYYGYGLGGLYGMGYGLGYGLGGLGMGYGMGYGLGYGLGMGYGLGYGLDYDYYGMGGLGMYGLGMYGFGKK